MQRWVSARVAAFLCFSISRIQTVELLVLTQQKYLSLLMTHTTASGLISRLDESASRREVSDLVSRRSRDSLQLNILIQERTTPTKPVENMKEFKCIYLSFEFLLCK